MNQIMQSQIFETQKQETINTNIKIQSTIPSINQNWIKGMINEFLEREIKSKQPVNITLEFQEQPIKHKIIKCTAQIEIEQNTTTIYGEGIDEYEAINNLINNLDIELKLNLNNACENNQHIFLNLTNKTNNQKRKGQCA